MRTSTDRIYATHVGSLPRPPDILQALVAHASGEYVDRKTFDPMLRAGVDELVAAQLERGIDVVADGELGKPSFMTYVQDRLAGFESAPVGQDGDSPWAGSKEMADFPEFYEQDARRNPGPAVATNQLTCTGPLSYAGHELVARDIENLKKAAAHHKAP